MKANQIMEKAWQERNYWSRKGYNNGKFILGIEVRNKLLAQAEFVAHGTIDLDTLMGFDFCVDTKNPHDINFCPIIE